MDNTSLQIERLAYEMKSYKDALIYFAETYLPDCDFEDILPTLHPNLVSKIRQEFIDKKYIPHLKQQNILDFMRD
jgi:hypothetical protein